jgi:hypothetical protein
MSKSPKSNGKETECAYNPAKSHTTQAALMNFIRAPVNDVDLKCVPGLGEKSVEKFHEHHICTVTQLIGKYLMFKNDSSMTGKMLADAYFNWLSNEVKIHTHQNEIVQAIAERCNLMIPGIYNAHEWEKST